MRRRCALVVLLLAGAACSQAEPSSTTTAVGAPVARPEQPTVTLHDGRPPARAGTVVFHSDREGRNKLFAVDLATNTLIRLTDGTQHHDEEPAVSPDGTAIAFVTTRFDSRTWDIAVVEAPGTAPRRITTHLSFDRQPAWTPDGRSLLVASEQEGTQAVFRVSLDGGAIARVSPEPDRALMPAVSPDGRRVAYAMGTPEGLRIVVQDLATGQWRAVTPAEQDAVEPAWSPDGTRLAYSRLWPDGGSSLEVRTIATGAVDQLVIAGMFAVREPAWSPTGDWIAAAASAAPGSGEDWDLLLLPPRSSSVGHRLTSGAANDRAPAWMPR